MIDYICDIRTKGGAVVRDRLRAASAREATAIADQKMQGNRGIWELFNGQGVRLDRIASYAVVIPEEEK